ncbi:TIGR00159 family protein [Thermanaerosceptrum fracticalcis]|uniref:Diadenylate cyclase n=2 Tax=Thermanaerosceptrum fracticalcis TaxID=1712410 RepID=A0A7G6E8H8_THEFR|nr:diadenylate cyclase CdaA [Thermanaerosceptrum fracticalcis]QNB48382.1 TIGR00159 family protein [Thermanaerosceptrum fracticalcis]
MFNIISIIDIAIVAFVIYKVMMIIKGTRAVQLIKGLVVLIMASLLSNWLGFRTFAWILGQVQTVLVVALPVVFQPELRRALEQLGRGRFFARPMAMLNEEALGNLVEEVVRAVKVLSNNNIGALIIIERETGVNDFIETGIKIDGLVSTEFLVNIFIPKSPLHDGAVIIRGDRVMAAGCFLPLSENPNLSKELGTRHRAGLGLTEQSDALGIIVSEETGVISIAEEGRLTRYLDENTLKEILSKRLQTKHNNTMSWFSWRS